MDGTTQALLFALLGAVLGAGVVLAWRVSDRQMHSARRSTSPPYPPGIATVLSVLRSSALVVDEKDEVLKASAPAYAFGLVRGNAVAVEELAELVRQVRRDGQIRETELVMSRGRASPPLHVTARVAPLSSRLVLALVEDRTRERRVEAIRRDFVANVSPRAEDPGRGAQPARRGGPGGRRRPGGGHPVRRPDADRERPADPARPADHRAVPAPGRRPARRAARPSTSTRSSTAASTRAPSTPQSKRISVVHDGERGLQILGNGDEVALALGNLVANAVAYSPDDSRVVVAARDRRD